MKHTFTNIALNCVQSDPLICLLKQQQYSDVSTKKPIKASRYLQVFWMCSVRVFVPHSLALELIYACSFKLNAV